MEMRKFHPKHPALTNILMQVVCLSLIVWIGYTYGGETIWSMLISLGFALLLSFDVVDQIAHYRSPKPHILVYDKGVVSNYRLIKWVDISSLSFLEGVNQIRFHLVNGEVIKIHLSNVQEPLNQFLLAVEEFAPHLTKAGHIEKVSDERAVA